MKIWPDIEINSSVIDIVPTQDDYKELLIVLEKSQGTKLRFKNKTNKPNKRFCLINSDNIDGTKVLDLISDGTKYRNPATNEYISSSTTKIIRKDEFVIRHQDAFLNVIKTCHLDDEGFEELIQEFESLLEEDEFGAQTLLMNTFSETLVSDSPDIDLQVRILKLLSNLPFSKLGAAATMIISSAYSLKDIRVKSATFNLFGHWANKKTLNILKQMEIPNEPWLRIKYLTLLEELNKKYALS